MRKSWTGLIWKEQGIYPANKKNDRFFSHCSLIIASYFRVMGALIADLTRLLNLLGRLDKTSIEPLGQL